VNIAVSASEANRSFSRLLRDVVDGTTVTVTSHGRPVAQIIPIDDEANQREAAHRRLMERLKRQKPVIIGPWTRDELYD
jgi:prevent-host-death family protein